MSGKKGRSGRRNNQEERDFRTLVNKSYNYLMRNFSVFSKEKRYHLSLEIVKKAMPSDINLKGEGLKTDVYNIIQTVQRGFHKSGKPPVVLAAGDGLDKGRTRPREPDQAVSVP